jgi:hypothetical protein
MGHFRRSCSFPQDPIRATSPDSRRPGRAGPVCLWLGLQDWLGESSRSMRRPGALDRIGDAVRRRGRARRPGGSDERAHPRCWLRPRLYCALLELGPGSLVGPGDRPGCSPWPRDFCQALHVQFPRATRLAAGRGTRASTPPLCAGARVRPDVSAGLADFHGALRLATESRLRDVDCHGLWHSVTPRMARVLRLG